MRWIALMIVMSFFASGAGGYAIMLALDCPPMPLWLAITTYIGGGICAGFALAATKPAQVG